MYSSWFTQPIHLYAWLNAFCPHPDSGALSQGIGYPCGALLVNWSRSDFSLVHPHWKPQMRRSTDTFIFIRGAQDKVSGSFFLSSRDGYKKSTETRWFLFTTICSASSITTICAVHDEAILQALFSHPYRITLCFCVVFVGFSKRDLPTILTF